MLGEDGGSSIKHRTTDVNPFDSRHRNGAREGLSVFGLVIGGSFVALSAYRPDALGSFWVLLGVTFVALVGGVFVGRLVQAANAPHPEVSPEVLAQEKAEETEKLIAAAKARGDFDRFGK